MRQFGAFFFCFQALPNLLLFYSLNLECFTCVVFNENVEHNDEAQTLYFCVNLMLERFL